MPISNKCATSKAEQMRAGGCSGAAGALLQYPWGRGTVAVLPGSKTKNETVTTKL
jgi:hypothetical protein